MTAQKLAQIARKIARQSGGLIKCKILRKRDMERLGMGAILAVNRGSENEPAFIDLTYKPASGTTGEVIGLVGKGITFDSGGLNIKGPSDMRDMKNDMGGAAAVLAVMSLLGELQPKVVVRAVIAATDNLVDARSVKPGDIVTTMSGLTVEVQDTDAEGRLTLADALHYIQTNGKATKLIDLATLTGSVGVALGDLVTGIFGNDAKFTRKVLKAASRAGEHMHELPLPDEYRDNNKSTMADLTNEGSGPGAIVAAWFLREFIQEGVSWVHCDIGETAFRSRAYGVDPEGATGVGVRTLSRFLIDYV
jgi:leucyl aminopeptidase